LQVELTVVTHSCHCG